MKWIYFELYRTVCMISSVFKGNVKTELTEDNSLAPNVKEEHLEIFF